MVDEGRQQIKEQTGGVRKTTWESAGAGDGRWNGSEMEENNMEVEAVNVMVWNGDGLRKEQKTENYRGDPDHSFCEVVGREAHGKWDKRGRSDRLEGLPA